MGNKTEIEQLTNDILDIHNEISNKINLILDQKENINSKLSYKIDDYVFYNSIIDNCVYYYTKSKDIRFKKLVKDFDTIIKDFNKISYKNKVVNNFNFDKNVVDKILQAYLECKKLQDSGIRWMKEKHELQDWAEELKKILIYHKFLIKSLFDSLICQVNYFTTKKLPDEFKHIKKNKDMHFCNCIFGENEQKKNGNKINLGCYQNKAKIDDYECKENEDSAKLTNVKNKDKIDKNKCKENENNMKLTKVEDEINNEFKVDIVI
jgi:hypothetical protein